MPVEQDLSRGVATGSSDCVAEIQPSVSNKNHLDPALFSLAKTPINLENLRRELIGYDHDKATAIFNGFSFGFPLYYSGSRVPTDSKNLKSANMQSDIVRKKIQAEVDAGRVAGPFQNRPLPNLRISPLGLVPKKEPGQFRLIHHLSYPSGKSLNDFIDPKLWSVQYTSFDEAVHNYGAGPGP